MSANPANPPNPGEMKMLPDASATPAHALPTTAITTTTTAAMPSRQMSEMPREELEHLAEEFGIDPTRFTLRQDLVAAIHDRRQMIAAMDRDAMLDVVRWGARPVTANASKEQIAQEIVRITSMRFAGLSQRGLVVLARLRGTEARGDEAVPVLVKRLKRKEGLFAKINRKRRAVLGGLVAKIVGEEGPTDYQFVPPAAGTTVSPAPTSSSAAAKSASIKQEIEDSGLLSGITNRLKKSADSYVNQKLDEIEARIDRKLDEIDRRLAEWRDKEIANRIRILKITLWASVIVAGCSLIYTYIDVHFFHPPETTTTTPQRQVQPAPQPPQAPPG